MPKRILKSRPRWTTERRDYVRAHYPTMMDIGLILESINAMSGPAVARKQMTSYARRELQLKRPPEAGRDPSPKSAQALDDARAAAGDSKRVVTPPNQIFAVGIRGIEVPRAEPPQPPPQFAPAGPGPFTMAAMRGPDPHRQARLESRTQGRRGQIADAYLTPLDRMTGS